MTNTTKEHDMTEPTETELDEATREGYAAGRSRASWVEIDSALDAQRIVTGYDDGWPEIMDLEPSPLSGEWAGESIPELSAEFGIDLENDDIATNFETGYSQGFWDEMLRRCRYQLAD